MAEELERLAPTVQLIFRLVDEFAAVCEKQSTAREWWTLPIWERLALRLLTDSTEAGELRPSPVALELQIDSMRY